VGRGARKGLGQVGRRVAFRRVAFPSGQIVLSVFHRRRVTFRVVVFRFRAHGFAANRTTGVGQQEGVRGDAPPSATAGAGDLEF
jgi:hypothetical protein